MTVNATSEPARTRDAREPVHLDRYLPLAVALIAGLFLGCATSQGPLPNPDAIFAERAGFSVAISGQSLISGARWSDVITDEAGKALVYRFNDPSWTLETTLFPDDDLQQAQTALFGERVDIEGNIAIIAAPGEVNGFVHSGAAYIFERTGPQWTQIARLTPDASSGAEFGRAVSLSGAYAFVGEDNPLLPTFGYGPGNVYVFRRNPGTGAWQQHATLNSSDAEDGDQFGHAVSVDGDVLAVGAPHEDSLGENFGAAYVFRRMGTQWVEEQQLTAEGLGAPAPLFGTSVSVSGEFVAVGAEGNFITDNDPEHTGKVYIFRFDESLDSWVRTDEIIAFDGEPGDEFGHSVSMDGNAVSIGAPGASPSGAASGSAYVYRKSDVSQNWLLSTKLLADDGGQGDRFGSSVSISDGCAAVGAPNWQEAGGPDLAGATYVFCDLPGIDDPGLQVAVDITCCEQPPAPGVPPEFMLRYSGHGARRTVIRRWVELRTPDGETVIVLRPESLIAPVDDVIEERGSVPISRDAAPGVYQLSVYWQDEKGSVHARHSALVHSELLNP